MKRTKNKLLSSLLCCLCWFAVAQPNEESFEFGYYNFVNYNDNSILLPQDNTLQHFFLSLDSLATGQKNKVNVVHIGDSHLQADFFSNQVRQKMQQTPYFGNGGRGFLFPYPMAKTNNPPFYTVKYSGSWKGCRNSMNSHHCEWGVSGVTATSYSPESYFEINLNPGQNNIINRLYTTNTIKVFYPVEDTTSFDIFLSVNDSLYHEKQTVWDLKFLK